MKRKGNIYIKTNKRTSLFIFIFSIICIIIAIVLYIFWLNSNNDIENIAEDIIEDISVETVADNENTVLVNPPKTNKKTGDYWDFITMPLISVDFKELKKKNKDTVAWINVNNTNINYPVVQSKNNSDYLVKAFDGSKNQAGWIFADYRNNMKDFDKNTILYGHSRVDKTMFGSLFYVLKSAWYNNKKNHIIKLSTMYENTLWQIFSVYKIPEETYYLQTKFSNNTKYMNFLKTLEKRSIYKFNTDINKNDKIITLSTCSDLAGTGRIVVHAKLIKLEKRK